MPAADDFASVLRLAGPRPAEGAAQAAKKNYAESFSRHLATLFATKLRPHFPGILPSDEGERQESRARSAKGVKKLDVNYSTVELGLGLGVSVKTLNYRDAKTKRYTKNYTRADNELRAEAMDYHVRQPFAVLVAVVFLPADACDDGATSGVPGSGSPSSFGAAVATFRHRAGRKSHRDDPDLFEGLFLAIYEHSGPAAGGVSLFDVTAPPPFRGRPRTTLSLDELIARITAHYDARNRLTIEWDDGGPEAAH